MVDNELACARLVSRLLYYADAERSADYADLFTPDGEMVGRHTAKGHEAIRAVMDSRPADRHTRHLLTAPLIEFSGPDEASSLAYASVYWAMESDRDADGSLTAAQPTIAEFRTSLRRTADGWRISRHAANVVFVPR